MRIWSSLILFLLMATAQAGGWEGGLVKVSKGTLLCDFFHMETALTLQSAGDMENLQAFIKKGYCMFAPSEFMATVSKDASTFTDPELAEIMYKGEEIWAAMKDLSCCYKRQ